MRLQGNTESLELVTSTAATLDVLIDWSESEVAAGDLTKAATYSDDYAISTATTTAILAAGASAAIRRDVTRLNARNKSNSLSCVVTLQKDVGGTNFELFKATLGIGEVLQYAPGNGWSIIDSNGMVRQIAVENKGIAGRPFLIYKLGSAAEAAGVPYFYGKDSGSPGAWAAGTPGLAGRATDGTAAGDAGALPIPNAATGANYLTGFQTMGMSQIGCPQLWDVLWVNSGIVVTTTTAQTINSVALPARDLNGATSGEGCMIGIYVAVATTNASAITNMTVSYTNSAGVAGRTATMSSFPATAVAGTVMWFQLAAGDEGPQSIQTATLGTSLGAGTVHLIIARLIAASPVLAASAPGLPATIGTPGMRLYNGACVLPFNLPGVTTAANLSAIAYVEEK